MSVYEYLLLACIALPFGYLAARIFRAIHTCWERKNYDITRLKL